MFVRKWRVRVCLCCLFSSSVFPFLALCDANNCARRELASKQEINAERSTTR